MAEQPEELLEGFFPEVEEEELADLESDELAEDLDDVPETEDLVVEESPPPPLGRTWAFDFQKPGFRTVLGRGPLEARGLENLRGWVEKCLRTPRGASPIHPDEYGIEGLEDLIGRGRESWATTDVAGRVREALTFHPRITDVVDFSWEWGVPDDESVSVSFTVILDGGNDRTPVGIENFPLVG